MGMETILKQLHRISDSEKIEIDDKALYQVARSAGGSMRDAQRTLDQVVAFSGKKVTIDDIRIVLGTIEEEVFLGLVEATLAQDAPKGLTVLRNVLDGGKDLGHFYNGLLETFRHLAVAKAFPSSAVELIPLSKEEVGKLSVLSSQMEEAQILSSLRLLIEQEWAVRHSNNPQIVIETLVLELCRMKQLVSVGDLLGKMESGAPIQVPAIPRPSPAVAKPSPTPALVAASPTPPAPLAQEGEPVFAVDEIEDAVEADKNPDMARLKSQWREIIEKAGKQKKMLEGILMDTHPKKLDEGTLVLVCKGAFHHEQISNPENKALLEQLLAEVVGRKITLVPVLPEGSASPGQERATGPRAPKPLSSPKVDLKELGEKDPLVLAAINMFGAKIVEVKRNNPQK